MCQCVCIGGIIEIDWFRVDRIGSNFNEISLQSRFEIVYFGFISPNSPLYQILFTHSPTGAFGQ